MVYHSIGQLCVNSQKYPTSYFIEKSEFNPQLVTKGESHRHRSFKTSNL